MIFLRRYADTMLRAIDVRRFTRCCLMPRAPPLYYAATPACHAFIDIDAAARLREHISLIMIRR